MIVFPSPFTWRAGWAANQRAWDKSWTWPDNVWAGVTVEDQQRADERLPWLVLVPAPVRFISAEPLRTGLDLSRWMMPLALVSERDAPRTWEEWNERGLWPDWIPQKTRDGIESFWGCFNRKPADWIRSHKQQGSPPTGLQVLDKNPMGHRDGDPPIAGRWVHCWNNMGRIVDAAGDVHVTSTPRAGLIDWNAPTAAHWQGIQWVIAGGESGQKARASSPDWFHSLRNQCIDAGVPFFFKQWGEWGPTRAFDAGDQLAILPGGEVNIGGGENGTPMTKHGKKAAGRLLDGREWSEFPS